MGRNFDRDGDGQVTDRELFLEEQISNLEQQAEKFQSQMRMSWVAMGTIVATTGLLMTPFVPIERVDALQDVFGMFYICVGGIVAAFFGVSAWVSKK